MTEQISSSRIALIELDSHAVGGELLSAGLARLGWDVVQIPPHTEMDEIERILNSTPPIRAVLVSLHTGIHSDNLKTLLHLRENPSLPIVPWYIRGEFGVLQRIWLRTKFRRVAVHSMSVGTVAHMLATAVEGRNSPAHLGKVLRQPQRISTVEGRDVCRTDVRGVTASRSGKTSPLHAEQLPGTVPQIALPAFSYPKLSRYEHSLEQPGVNTIGVASNILHLAGIGQQYRGIDRHPERIVKEALKHGISSIEGGPVSHTLSCWSDMPVNIAIDRWQQADRILALSGQHERELCGTLTGSLIPPSLAIAIGTLEALLAARQGIRSFVFSYAEQGNRAQDIAAVQAARTVLQNALAKSGYNDATVRIAFAQYPGALPVRTHVARSLLDESIRTALEAGADRVILRAPEEGHRTPSPRHYLHAARRAADIIAAHTSTDRYIQKSLPEAASIVKEAEAIISAVMAQDPDLVRAIIRSCNSGLLDVPFAPSSFARRQVRTAHDATGAVKFWDAGNVAIPQSSRQEHREAILHRMHENPGKGESIDACIEHDVNALKWEKHASCWPRDTRVRVGSTVVP